MNSFASFPRRGVGRSAYVEPRFPNELSSGNDVFRRDRFRYFRADTAAPVAPDRKTNEDQIGRDKGRDIGFAANTEAVAVQTGSEDKVHSVPRHQDGQKTNDAGNNEAELSPP